MPSTYSPNLRIELIANGEQSGTWGTTTNTNLGTLIESAISGYVSVLITSVNQALTAQNGADDQSRNMVVDLTTTTGSSFNVYIPPAEKIYIIRNSSAYPATIYCSTVIGNTTAAGTGVTIPAGKQSLIFSDGTDVNAAVDYAASLSLGSALEAAFGGTGQSSYTVGDLLVASGATTLTKLADVATGNVLLSGGIGVAPAYGKVGLSTHVSGILPVANGGTGASTLSGVLIGNGTGAVTSKTNPTGAFVGTTDTQTLTNKTLSTGSSWAGDAIAAIYGGTGQSSYTTGDLLVASSSTALTKLAGVATGNALISGGIGSQPTYGKIGLTTHVSGTLPVANGGTGATTSTGTGSVVLAASPALTGTPTAPTATSGTNTTQIATTAFVQAAVVASQSGLADPGTNGVVVRTANGVTTARTIAGGSGITVSNGDGVSGNPSVAISTSGVGTTELASAAVTEAKLASSAVTEAKIATAAVTNAKIADGSVSEGKLSTFSVTNSKIADGAVTNSKLGSSAVAEGNIGSFAVTNSKIASGAVTADKLSGVPIIRAWVNFDGTKDTSGSSSTANTNRLIRQSYNVTSVLRTGTGVYTVTMTNGVGTTTYVINVSCADTTVTAAGSSLGDSGAAPSQTSTTFRVVTYGAGSANKSDASVVCATVIG